MTRDDFRETMQPPKCGLKSKDFRSKSFPRCRLTPSNFGTTNATNRTRFTPSEGGPALPHCLLCRKAPLIPRPPMSNHFRRRASRLSKLPAREGPWHTSHRKGDTGALLSRTSIIDDVAGLVVIDQWTYSVA